VVVGRLVVDVVSGIVRVAVGSEALVAGGPEVAGPAARESPQPAAARPTRNTMNKPITSRAFTRLGYRPRPPAILFSTCGA
jgi:hypothetical protein